MRTIRLAPTLVILAALAACGPNDKRLDRLTVGISKDSTSTLMGVEKPVRVDPFLVGGKYIEVMYYAPPGATESTPDRKTSPLISIDGVLIGWGWKALDSLSAATNIPVQPK